MKSLYQRLQLTDPDSLSRAQKAGQCLMLPAFIYDTEEEVRILESRIRELWVGSLCFFRSREAVEANVAGLAGKNPASSITDELERLSSLIQRYQSASPIPLLIAIDAEWGLSMRIDGARAYPYALCLGASDGGEHLIRELGLHIALDCRKAGIHWNLAPVVDLHLNPDNPVIGYRSFGSDPERVSRAADAYRSGLSQAGVLHCLKHFPGHGDTRMDSHLGLPVVERNREEQEKSEERPYRLLVGGSTDAVMAAHVAFPELTGGTIEPATLSTHLLQGYLREGLGYQGIIISDALNMGGVAGRHDRAGVLECRAFQSGCDVLCFPIEPEEAVREITEQLSGERIEQSFQRLWRLKSKGLQAASEPLTAEPNFTYPGLLEEIAVRSLTLAHGTSDDVRSFLQFGPCWEVIGESVYGDFRQACMEELDKDSSDYLLLALFPPSLKPSEDFGWGKREWDRIGWLLEHRRIGLYLFGNPALLERIPWKKSHHLLVAYVDKPEFQRMAWKHFSGRIEARGILPYTLRPSTDIPEPRYRILGLMSGTSLDGLDMAYVEFCRRDGQWRYALGPCETIPYTPEWRDRLRSAIDLPEHLHDELDREYGLLLGRLADEFLRRNQLVVDAIGSHGHTSHHRPQEGITFQLGNGAELAGQAGTTVVCDFRSQDVGLGGQGAPLVPVGDRLLFRAYTFCLNLGGISNVSLEEEGRRIAYDIGLANLPLNYLSEQLGMPYDSEGKLARGGNLSIELLDELNRLAYYDQLPPKSTGLEWVRTEVYPLLDRYELPIEDKLHTVVAHNCQQIRKALKKHHPAPGARVLVTGGGVRNLYLLEQLRQELDGIAEVVVPDQELIDYKEALVFALLAVLRLRNEVNVFSSVTGALRDHCSGRLYRP